MARCPAWAGQARIIWRRVERLCEWETPRAPAVRLMFDDVRATPAVLSFLQDTRVSRMVSLCPQGEEGEEDREESRRELIAKGRRAGRDRLEGVSFLCLSFAPLVCLFFLAENREAGGPITTNYVGLGQE